MPSRDGMTVHSHAQMTVTVTSRDDMTVHGHAQMYGQPDVDVHSEADLFEMIMTPLI